MDAADEQMKQLLAIGASGAASSLEELVESTADGVDAARMDLVRKMPRDGRGRARARRRARRAAPRRGGRRGARRRDDGRGTLARRAKKFDEAEPLLVGARDAWARELGEEHEKTLKAANSLAVVFANTGRMEEAEALYRATYDARRRSSATRAPRHAELGRQPRGPAHADGPSLEEAEDSTARRTRARKKKSATIHPDRMSANNLAPCSRTRAAWRRPRSKSARRTRREARSRSATTTPTRWARPTTSRSCSKDGPYGGGRGALPRDVRRAQEEARRRPPRHAESANNLAVQATGRGHALPYGGGRAASTTPRAASGAEEAARGDVRPTRRARPPTARGRPRDFARQEGAKARRGGRDRPGGARADRAEAADMQARSGSRLPRTTRAARARRRTSRRCTAGRRRSPEASIADFMRAADRAAASATSWGLRPMGTSLEIGGQLGARAPARRARVALRVPASAREPPSSSRGGARAGRVAARRERGARRSASEVARLRAWRARPSGNGARRRARARRPSVSRSRSEQRATSAPERFTPCSQCTRTRLRRGGRQSEVDGGGGG